MLMHILYKVYNIFIRFLSGKGKKEQAIGNIQKNYRIPKKSANLFCENNENANYLPE